MIDKKEKSLVGKKEWVWVVALIIFFTINMNNDWHSSSLLWYGCLMLVVIAYVLAFKGAFLLKFSPYFMWLISFMFLGMFSILWCLNIQVVIDVIKTLIVWVIMLLFIQFSLNMGFKFDTLLKAFLFATLINAIYVILTIDIAALGEVQLGANMLEGWNGNGIGFMMAQGAIIGWYLLGQAKKAFSKLVLLLCVVFFAVLTMYTGSRTAFIMLIAEFVIYICLKSPIKIVRNMLIVAAMLVLAFYVVMNVESFYKVLGVRLEGLISLFTGKGSADSSAISRDLFIENGKIWFAENPIFGVGLNNYKVLNQVATGRFTYSHNTFIELAVDLGIVGLIWYYSIYIYLTIIIFKHVKNKHIKALLLSALIASLISQYGTVSYYGFYQNLLLFLCFYAANKFKKGKGNI